MLNECRGRVDELSENFNKEMGNIKKNHSEIKNILTELKTTLQGINRDRDETEDRIRNLEDKVGKNTQSEQ